jgi:transposase-like protein
MIIFMRVNAYDLKNPNKMPILWKQKKKKKRTQQNRQTSIYNCNNKTCTRKNFIQEYTNKAYQPNVREQVLKMTVNGTGTRATGRILGISKDTVTAILKKQKSGPGK